MVERHIRSISFSVIQHYTEVKEKIMLALKTLLPETLAKEYTNRVTSISHRGFHGNIITIYKLEVTKRKDANHVFSHIICSMSHGERTLLLNTLDSRTDESGNLYFRLSKQDAYQGDIRLSEGDDTIRVVVKPLHPSINWTQVINRLCTKRKQ